jgi:hypothetical protein
VFNSHPRQFVALTALWAFVESGLGGVLHAFHLPFTGIVLGGFSILIISLLALRAQNVLRDILTAALTVAAIKAIANPITSPFAYIALGFQAVWGGLIYSICKTCKMSHFVFATIAMLESAVQQLFTATLIAGKSFWVAVNGLSETVCKIFHVKNAVHPNYMLVYFYIAIFLVWGFVLAAWLCRLQRQIESRLHLYKPSASAASSFPLSKRATSFPKVFSFIAIVFLILSFSLPKSLVGSNLLVFVLRTISALVVWRYVMVPVWAAAIGKWSAKYGATHKHVHTINKYMPWFRTQAAFLLKEIRSKYSGFRFIKELVLGLIVLSFSIPENE